VVRQAFAAGKREALPGLVAGLVKTPVDVIITTSNPETLAAKRATSTIPIVMTVVLDPVRQGLVVSLARPGGNVTGLTSLVPGLSQKYVELLKEIVPSTSRFAVVIGPAGLPPRSAPSFRLPRDSSGLRCCSAR
jgi:putative ABC transport system substrate-binding protein